MIHASDTNACYGTNQSICRISTCLQQICSNTAADVGFRSHGTKSRNLRRMQRRSWVIGTSLVDRGTRSIVQRQEANQGLETQGSCHTANTATMSKKQLKEQRAGLS